MSKFIMLECNRLNGRKQYGGIDENQDEFKNKWVNNVNSYGIQLDVGDVITCEAAAINTIGASDSTIEFTGNENKNGYLDHKVKFDMAYYVNDSGKYGMRRPLINEKTSYGYDTSRGDADSFISKATAAGTNAWKFLSSRSLGEPYLGGAVHQGPVRDDIVPFSVAMPHTDLVYSIKLKETSPSAAGFRIGGLYEADQPSNGATITDFMIIKVLEVTSVTGTANIPTNIEIHHVGAGYTGNNFTCRVQTPVDGGSAPSHPATIIVESYKDTRLKTKQSQGADGRRYYFGPLDWTGPCMINYNGIPEDENTGLDTDDLKPEFSIRTTQIELEAPIGLSTPDNIAALVTDQLHKGEKVTSDSTDLAFDLTTLDEFETKGGDDLPTTRKPVLFQTPTYRLQPLNNCWAAKNRRMDSFSGVRRQYYASLGIDDPKKWLGLQWTRQLRYGLTNADPTNQLNSGANQTSNLGDFQNQEMGNLGQTCKIMMNLPNDDASPVGQIQKKAAKGSWILTNVYYTEENLKIISQAFRKGEKYFDDTSKTIDTRSNEYKKALAVAFDLGLYLDEDSTTRELIKTSTGTPPTIGPPNRNQRKRFQTQYHAYTNPTDPIFTDVDSNAAAPCIGTIPYASDFHRDGTRFNDGQELSHLVVTSRYDGDLPFDDANIVQNYQDLYDILDHEDGTKFANDGASMRDVFSRNYVDQSLGEQSYIDLFNLSKKYDIAVIPVFPNDPLTEYHKFGGRPFIAFKSHYELGYDADFNSSSPSRDGKWGIDEINTSYGVHFGLDVSAIRNNLMTFFNPNFSDSTKLGDVKAYMPIAFMGAVNPSLDFNPSLSRMEFQGLNTPYTIGNGNPASNQYNIEPSPNPEQQAYGIGVVGDVVDIDQGGAGGVNAAPLKIFDQKVQASPTGIIESYSGLAWNSVILFDGDGNEHTFDFSGVRADPTYDTTKQFFQYFDQFTLDETFLGKLGFTIDQFLPLLGSSNAVFTNPLTFKNEGYGTIFDNMRNTPNPMTTGAFISSAEYQPTGVNSLDQPYYGLEVSTGLPSEPAVVQASLTAFNLPTKLSTPYFLIYSSLLSEGTYTDFYGGVDGKSRLPCIGYITRNYNEGDFFYSLEQGFNFSVNKPFTITEVETEIRVPDGTRPRLQPHSSVFYKITKAIQPIQYALPSPKSRKKRAPSDDEEDSD